MFSEQVDENIYSVVVNTEEQYSIWPEYKGDPPDGWKLVGVSGLKSECLSYIDEVWTDMRPLSLRKQMSAIAEEGYAKYQQEEALLLEQSLTTEPDPRDNLVQYLSIGNHAVEIDLKPDCTLDRFKEAIDRGYIHIKFTSTRGNTVLGIRIDKNTSRIPDDIFDSKAGKIYIEGTLTLNYSPVRCISEINIESFAGHAHLEPIENK